jgi:hypothetical protein
MTGIKWLMGAALLASLAIAGAVDFRERQEGLWDRHIQAVVNPGAKKTDLTSTVCRDHAYDKSVTVTKPQDKSCSFNLVDLGGGKYSSEIRCTVQGSVVETKQTFLYQAGTSVHSETRMTYAPPLGGRTDQTITLDEKYVGACPAGMKPGDESDPTIQ